MSANPIDHFTWSQKIPGVAELPVYVTHAALVGLIICVAAILAYGKLKNPKDNVIPDRSLNLKTIFELLTEFIYNMVKGILGHNAEKYVPLLGTIFIFILVSNCIGLVPGFSAPTTNVNTNFAIALMVFLYYNYLGFAEHGFGYLKHFLGPIWWLAPIFFLIEIIGNLVRPISLTLRLFGNMNGDHLVLNIFSNLTPLVVPVVFLALGFLVCLIQAFVFTILSVIYISLAVAHEEH